MVYGKQKTVFSPYLQTGVVLNSDGFHHLQFSDRRERGKEEQLLKFNLLPLALEVIKKSGTVQEYRKSLIKTGKTSLRDGMSLTKSVQYWGFVAIIGDSKIKIRTIIRRIGDGNFMFWSVMPDTKLKGGQKLYTGGMEDD